MKLRWDHWLMAGLIVTAIALVPVATWRPCRSSFRWQKLGRTRMQARL